MELWIRSQDKETLSKIINIKIERTQILGNTKEDNWDILLGTYKTKERALEVLDEIQNILKPQLMLTKMGEIVCETCDGTVYSTPNEYDIKKIPYYVYQMPEE